jgi:hypothetical protein
MPSDVPGKTLVISKTSGKTTDIIVFFIDIPVLIAGFVEFVSGPKTGRAGA